MEKVSRNEALNTYLLKKLLLMVFELSHRDVWPTWFAASVKRKTASSCSLNTVH